MKIYIALFTEITADKKEYENVCYFLHKSTMNDKIGEYFNLNKEIKVMTGEAVLEPLHKRGMSICAARIGRGIE